MNLKSRTFQLTSRKMPSFYLFSFITVILTLLLVQLTLEQHRLNCLGPLIHRSFSINKWKIFLRLVTF